MGISLLEALKTLIDTVHIHYAEGIFMVSLRYLNTVGFLT